MLEFNQAWLTGYLVDEPRFWNYGAAGDEKVRILVRTARLKTDLIVKAQNLDEEYARIQSLLDANEEECFGQLTFEDVLVFYDGTSLMPKFKTLHAHDFIMLKGAFNIHPIQAGCECQACGEKAMHSMPLSSVYPIDLIKLNSARGAYGETEKDDPRPKNVLVKHYLPISNQMLLQAIVMRPPRIVTSKKQGKICILNLAVNRQYFIKTQDDTLDDHPVVYAYGEEADWAEKHLKALSGVYYQCAIHPKKNKRKVTCPHCGADVFVAWEYFRFIPYKRIHAANYATDEELALQAKNEALLKAAQRMGGGHYA